MGKSRMMSHAHDSNNIYFSIAAGPGSFVLLVVFRFLVFIQENTDAFLNDCVNTDRHSNNTGVRITFIIIIRTLVSNKRTLIDQGEVRT